jgi:hypothetical protein
MELYSQKDPKYRNLKVGFGTQTIGQVGCFLCSLSMISEIEPPEANERLKKNGGYSGNLIKSAEAAKALGLEYGGRVSNNNKFPCIMETNHYKSKGVPQHFVVMTDATHILDPLDYPVKEKKNKYNIISYRLFKQKNMEKEYHVKSVLKNALQELIGDEDYGKEMNENEQERSAKALIEYRENCEKYADGFEKAVEKSLELGDRLKQAKATTSGYVEKVRELNAELVKKNEEIKKLKEDSTAYNLLNRLKQAVLDLINFK